MHYTDLILSLLRVSEQPVPLAVIYTVFESLTTDKLPGPYLRQLESKGLITIEDLGDGTKLVSIPKPIDLEKYERRADAVYAIQVTDAVLKNGVNLIGSTLMGDYIHAAPGQSACPVHTN